MLDWRGKSLYFDKCCIGERKVCFLDRFCRDSLSSFGNVYLLVKFVSVGLMLNKRSCP